MTCPEIVVYLVERRRQCDPPELSLATPRAIAQSIGCSVQALQPALSILAEDGLVGVERHPKAVYYFLTEAGIAYARDRGHE